MSEILTDAEEGANAAAIAIADRSRKKSAVVEIKTPDGIMYLESGHPEKVEIGEINLPGGMSVDIKTDGEFKVGSVNVGMEQVSDRQSDYMTTYNIGAPEAVFIAAMLIVFSVIGVLGWRALSIQTRS